MPGDWGGFGGQFPGGSLRSGGLDKLAVYKKLGIREVWFWKNRRFEVYHLRGEEYQKMQQSELLPNLDLSL